MLNVLIWLMGALAVAGAITWDMRRLRVNRVGLPSPAWWALCVPGWPLVILAYLVLRRKVRRQLVASVWHYVGDEHAAPSLRHTRLLALHRHGLVAESIFEECLQQIETDRSRSDGPNE